MPVGNSYPDPGVEFGSFRVLPQTTGGFIIVDKRRRPGKQQVGAPFRKLEEAVRAAREWHEAGHG
jgi:hypothetical protein